MPTPSGHAYWTLTSTGSGAGVDFKGYNLEGRVYIEAFLTSTLSYQILTARTSTSPAAILSSGTLSSGACDVKSVTGPVKYLWPRIKTLAGTGTAGSTGVFVEFFGV